MVIPKGSGGNVTLYLIKNYAIHFAKKIPLQAMPKSGLRSVTALLQHSSFGFNYAPPMRLLGDPSIYIIIVKSA